MFLNVPNNTEGGIREKRNKHYSILKQRTKIKNSKLKSSSCVIEYMYIILRHDFVVFNDTYYLLFPQTDILCISFGEQCRSMNFRPNVISAMRLVPICQ